MVRILRIRKVKSVRNVYVLLSIRIFKFKRVVVIEFLVFKVWE